MKYNFQIYYLNNIGWIRIRIDPELLPGSGSRKIPSWIRFRNKSFRIHKFSRPRSGSAFNMRIRIQEGKWSMRIRVHSPAYGTRGHDIHTRGFFLSGRKGALCQVDMVLHAYPEQWAVSAGWWRPGPAPPPPQDHATLPLLLLSLNDGQLWKMVLLRGLRKETLGAGTRRGLLQVLLPMNQFLNQGSVSLRYSKPSRLSLNFILATSLYLRWGRLTFNKTTSFLMKPPYF